MICSTQVSTESCPLWQAFGSRIGIENTYIQLLIYSAIIITYIFRFFH